VNYTVPGLLFAALWASASVATKFGVQSVHPLILANARFFIAGTSMLLFAYGVQRSRTGKSEAYSLKNAWPTRTEFRQLSIFALLNTTIYLGAFVIALKAGVGGNWQFIYRD
jgi:drug/metabolite transporter (DMT)-like permease